MTQRVRISVLGGFRIETAGLAREDRLPRKLAALVGLLAVAGGRGIARERVVALLWGEGDEERGRHALAQSVYALRRSLNLDDLILGTDRLCLNEGVVCTDLADLRSAIVAGDATSLLALGRGVLLDGLSVPGAPGFERWLEEERRDLQRTLIVALDRVAGTTEDPDLRVTLRRRRAELDPLDAIGAMALMRALAAAGDLPSAVQHARVHGELVRQELEFDPDPRVAQLVDELRLAPAAVTVPGPAAQAAAPIAPPHRDLARVIVGATHRVQARVRGILRQVPWRLVRQAGAAATFLLTVMLALAHYGKEHVAPGRAAARVAVLPFAALGTTAELDFLRTGMIDLLGHAMAERDSLPLAAATLVTARWPVTNGAVPPDSMRGVAESLGARRLVTGTIVGSGERLVLRAELRDTAAAVLGDVTVSGPLDSLAPLVRRAATQLVALAHGEVSGVGARELAPRVMRAWLDGRDHYRRGRWVEARRSFAAALAGDSTFDVAAVHLALAADWLDDAVTRESAIAHVAPRAGGLPPLERALAVALRDPRYPMPRTAEEFFAGWEDAARAAERAEWWVEVGRRYLADGPAAGIQDAPARAAKAFARALAIDATDAAVVTVLGPAEGGSIAAPRTEPALVARWREALREGNAESLARLRGLLGTTPDGDVRAVAAALLREGGHAADVAQLVAHRTEVALGSWARRDAALSAHALALDRGDGLRVREAVMRIDDLASDGAGDRLAILDALYGGADTAGIGAIVARVEARMHAEVSTLSQRREAVADRCVAEQWRAWRRLPSVPGALAQLQRDTLGPGSLTAAVSGPACAALVTAIRERLVRRPTGVAVHRAEQLALAGPAAGDLRQYATLALARVQLELGDRESAWRLVQRRPNGRGWPRYLAAFDRLEGLIAAERADSVAARAALRRYLARRSAADVTFSRDVDEVTRQLERLTPES